MIGRENQCWTRGPIREITEFIFKYFIFRDPNSFEIFVFSLLSVDRSNDRFVYYVDQFIVENVS